MGNCSGHWNNWNKNDKGKFERNDHKSKHEHKNSCDSCGHHDKSSCDCNFRRIKEVVKLNSDCIVVNSVVCSKMVQKVAELPFALTAFSADIPATATILSVTVTPNLAAIVHNVRVIRDKVVNIGFIPVTVSVVFTATPGGTPATVTATANLPFQEHTDCPGACPEDTVTESPFIVEGTFAQPGITLGLEELVPGILIKVILRTNLTVTRPVIVDKHGGLCDVNDRRCDLPTNPPTFTLGT
ncbi:hypothetical protein P4646_09580 [Peribacillus simplex]|uniref:hypothetical protein n=1 Tax=Peribacillus simplex TaxID=1478 RepID=UPI002E24D4F7|nr:hypothetical protein [Peribacillus simplex]